MRELKKDTAPKIKKTGSIEHLSLELLNSVTVVHMAHLSITGPGSFAAHKAMGDYYSGVADLVDDVVEHYQGIEGRIFTYPSSVSVPQIKTAEQCCSYLKHLRKMIDEEQGRCPYSEVVNTLDEIKSLIDSTCYKLTFLK